jgi:hypothetical protein
MMLSLNDCITSCLCHSNIIKKENKEYVGCNYHDIGNAPFIGFSPACIMISGEQPPHRLIPVENSQVKKIIECPVQIEAIEIDKHS